VLGIKKFLKKKYAKMTHAWIVVLFESTPVLTHDLSMTVTETFTTFKRTFLTKSLSVAMLLKLKFNGTSVEECEKNLDTLFYTHDYDASKSISKKEYVRLGSDFIQVCKEFQRDKHPSGQKEPKNIDEAVEEQNSVERSSERGVIAPLESSED
jgi:hypothetical protein